MLQPVTPVTEAFILLQNQAASGLQLLIQPEEQIENSYLRGLDECTFWLGLVGLKLSLSFVARMNPPVEMSESQWMHKKKTQRRKHANYCTVLLHDTHQRK